MSAAALIARVPMAMLTLGLVLLVQSVRGSYGLAGAVSATFAVAQAVASPWLSRRVDQRGQRGVTAVAYGVHALALLALVALLLGGAPTAALLATAAVSGAALPLYGVLVRARWTAMLSEPTALHAAYSLESVLDEVCFVVGPVLVTVLATRVDRLAGLAAALVLETLGTVALLLQRSTEPAPRPARATAPAARRVPPALAVLAAAGVAMGTIFGSVEVATVAAATDAGARGSAGLVLAAFSAASLVGGVVVGLRPPRRPPGARLRVAACWLGAAAALLPLARPLLPLTAVMVVAGIAISPTVIAMFALVERTVAGDRLTEGMTWVSTSITVGVALGAATTGPIVDATSGRGGFVVSAAAGLCLVAVAALARRALAAAGVAPVPPVGLEPTLDGV